ncbi:CKLF-like MARVEL transmembrane domain-containing protein 8b [Pimephales promelas]|uniref:CKLF-like MARVEL transmembrane domain-containing protein 8b n=1 Tax=Pimephales promelas TaxID=90988 RepID=UPI001955F42A|nr:CKLF-like MARVEL transmembrane domain-containing protein 8b [Pimephales promelas]KAG1940108.1 CKLF-like MARVEL transmembrane domain-containing protein [Pimephales promelas]
MEIDSESRIDRSSADRTSKSSNIESLGLSHSKLAYDGNFIRSACGMFMAGEIVFGLLVWTLIGGTEYLHVPALGWVMFVSVLCWVLTVILFLLYLTTAHTRIPQIPWTILGICFNGSASVLYLTAAVVTGVSSNVAIRGRYYFISWVASTIFASIAMVCYAGNTFVNYKSWRSKCEDT